MQSKNLSQLLASTDGWSLGHVVDWLFNEGQQVIEPVEFTDRLCEKLLESGAPIFRLRIAFRTLHPLVAACAFTWLQGRDATEFCLLHEDSREEDLTDLDSAQPEFKESIDTVTLQLKSPVDKPGIISIFTRSPGGFSTEDISKFEILTMFLSPVINVIAIRRIAKTILDTYIGHRAGGKVLDGLIKRGDGETIDAVIWYCDLRDFTLLTETLARDELLSMLNTYFEYISAAVSEHGGEVLRFIGDAMLIVFPVDSNVNISHTCKLALDAAIDILRDLKSVNQQRLQQGYPEIRFGIGLHIGQVIYGNVGAPDRLDFTVMGAAVNRTARLEELTKKVGVPLLLSTEFAEHTEGPVRSMGEFEMRGVTQIQEVFALLPDESLEAT
ncbi:MAG: adenylate/guanylate cyclase domain-containing protein [Gammaproteobacteria bacterium]|nr:adenylate/guanylate cyclase domain-containing protein [Gammaproteobacteria bacterium]